ncbi:MAG: sigma factor, partial [Planctomycetia bacterium]
MGRMTKDRRDVGGSDLLRDLRSFTRISAAESRELLEKSRGVRGRYAEVKDGADVDLTRLKNLAGQLEARRLLQEGSVGLVFPIVGVQISKNPSLEPFRCDIWQEGFLGLARGIDRFDLERPNVLSTYAVWKIIAAVTAFGNRELNRRRRGDAGRGDGSADLLFEPADSRELEPIDLLTVDEAF